MSNSKKEKTAEEEILYFTVGGKLFRQPRQYEIDSNRAFVKSISLRRLALLKRSKIADVRHLISEISDTDVEDIFRQQAPLSYAATWGENYAILIPVPLRDEDAVRYGYESCVVCGRTKEYLHFGDEDGGISVEGNNAFLECTCSGCKSEYNLVFKLDGVGGGVKIFGES